MSTAYYACFDEATNEKVGGHNALMQKPRSQQQWPKERILCGKLRTRLCCRFSRKCWVLLITPGSGPSAPALGTVALDGACGARFQNTAAITFRRTLQGQPHTKSPTAERECDCSVLCGTRW